MKMGSKLNKALDRKLKARWINEYREAIKQRDRYREALRAECGDDMAERWRKIIEGESK